LSHLEVKDPKTLACRRLKKTAELKSASIERGIREREIIIKKKNKK